MKQESVVNMLSAFEDALRHDPEIESEETIVWYLRRARMFVAWCDEQGYTITAEALKRRTFESYISYVRTRPSQRNPDKKLKPPTVDTHTRTLKKLGKWAKFTKRKKKNPARKLKLISGSYRPPDKAIPIEVAHAFIQAATQSAVRERLATGRWRKLRDLAMLLVLADSGARIGEVISMRWGTTDVARRQAEVTGKTGTRTIYFYRLAAHVLRVYRNEGLESWQRQSGQPCWWGYDPRREPEPITRDGFRDAMERLSDEAGYPWCGTHSFRHAFAANIAEAGIGDIVLCQLMGHSDISTTRRYARLSSTALHRVFDRLEAEGIGITDPMAVHVVNMLAVGEMD